MRTTRNGRVREQLRRLAFRSTRDIFLLAGGFALGTLVVGVALVDLISGMPATPPPPRADPS